MNQFPSFASAFRDRDSIALGKLIQERWSLSLPPDQLNSLLYASSSKRGVGGTSASPWSDSSWSIWVKNRLDDLAKDPNFASSPANHFGAQFSIETNPTDPASWKAFLEDFNRVLLESAENEGLLDLYPEMNDRAWPLFEPASEAEIQEAERRLGRRLPPSLRTFYSVSNGWRGPYFDECMVVPTHSVGWLKDCDSVLHQIALDAMAYPGPFKDDPDNRRLIEYRMDQGTRFTRSLLVMSSATCSWVLDPGEFETSTEWPGGCWSEGVEWNADHFGVLMAAAYRASVSD